MACLQPDSFTEYGSIFTTHILLNFTRLHMSLRKVNYIFFIIDTQARVLGQQPTQQLEPLQPLQQASSVSFSAVKLKLESSLRQQRVRAASVASLRCVGRSSSAWTWGLENTSISIARTNTRLSIADQCGKIFKYLKPAIRHLVHKVVHVIEL